MLNKRGLSPLTHPNDGRRSMVYSPFNLPESITQAVTGMPLGRLQEAH